MSHLLVALHSSVASPASHMLVLASGSTSLTPSSTGTFWTTPVGTVLKTLLAVFGLLVILWTVVNVTKDMASGKKGEAGRKILGAVAACVFLFAPEMIQSVMDVAVALFNKVISSTSSIVGN